MNILGISRSPRFSPNSVDRDAAIFAAVSSKLQSRGHDVFVISEDLFVAVDLSEFDMVYSMARGRDVLENLARAEQEAHLCVVNSALALLKATRHELVSELEQGGIPQPRTQVLTLGADGRLTESCTLNYPLWLKRGDACAQQAGDVCFLSVPDKFGEALEHFAVQSVSRVIAVEHAEGDLIKFYGVEGTDFFFFTYPTDGQGFSKFGLEQHNGRPSHSAFDADELKAVADKAAIATGFTIYGGDAIVRPDGTFVIIDFNDWPSFSTCRKQAARAIAQRLTQ